MSEAVAQEKTLENATFTVASRSSTDRLSWKQRTVAWSAALLLIAAAVLKAWPMVTGQAVESQAASLLKLILIQGEILLALWLVSEVAAAWAFRAAMVFFAGAAVVNLRSIWLGEESCGCFGQLAVPPWISLVFNAVLLTTLILVQPRMVRGLFGNVAASWKSMGWVAPACVLIVAVGGAGAFARSYFRPVMIEAPKEIDLGRVLLDRNTVVVVRLRNEGDIPVTIIGAKTSCTCAVVEGLPRVIEPATTSNIRLAVRFNRSQLLAGRVILYTDHQATGAILVKFRATIIDTTIKENL